MHILQLLPSLTVGGVERGVIDLTKGLVERGHRVSVVSSGGVLVDALTRLGAAHHQLPIHEKNPATLWSCLPPVVRIIQSTDVDIVHARSRMPGWIGWLAARKTQKPFVTTAHGFYKPHLASQVMVWGRLVIAPSEALARYLIQEFHLPQERLRIIPRGVNLQEFAFAPSSSPHQGPWRLGVFGRLSPIKGQAFAIEACAILRRRGMIVQLCLSGDAPQTPARRHLESLIQKLNLQSQVEWLGVRQDIPALIASVDVVLAPSTYPESFGRGVVEAQAVGRPVVASRIGALSELIDDARSGLLVAPKDPHALADAVERLIKDDSLRASIVAQARRSVEDKYPVGRMVEATLAVYEECVTRPRILIWKLSALGDVILSTPSLRGIRKHFPQASITLAVGRAAYEAVARCPYVDDFFIYDRKKKDRGFKGIFGFIRRIRRAGFDISIDLQNSRQTHLWSYLAGIPVRIGYKRKFGSLLNKPVRLPKVVLAPIAHQHYLLNQAGLSTDGEALEFWPSPLDEQAADKLLAPLNSPKKSPSFALIGLHPGGSLRWETKRWDLRRWAMVCEALMKRGARVVIVGGAEEKALGQSLAGMMSQMPLILTGQTTLSELACVVKRCDVFLAHDSSTLHLAAVMGVPTVALFGPTDPKRHLPPTFKGQVIAKDVFCSPCYSPRCKTITHACMNRISVDEVLSAVMGLLAETQTPVA